MAIWDIPCAQAATSGKSWWKQQTALDGVLYLFEFQWTQRDGAWVMHLSDVTGSPIAVGIKLLPLFDLLRTVIDTRRPVGRLQLWDLAGTQQNPTFSTLGTQYQLRYYDAAELALVTTPVAQGGYGLPSLAAYFGS